jgi:hypothetical protein
VGAGGGEPVPPVPVGAPVPAVGGAVIPPVVPPAPAVPLLPADELPPRPPAAAAATAAAAAPLPATGAPESQVQVGDELLGPAGAGRKANHCRDKPS